MSEFETILRQRLGAMEDPKDHPDPDTLTAYVEELLPKAERNGVFNHLSLCKQCRDVVALTMPDRPLTTAVASEETADVAQAEVATVPVPRRWWFLTPQFGLAASLVAVAAGVFLVLEIPRIEKIAAPVQTAAVAPKPVAPADSQASSPLPTNELSSTQPSNGAISRGVQPQPANPALSARIAPPSLAGRVQDRNVVAVAPEVKSVIPRNQSSSIAGSRTRDYINNQVLANQQLLANQVFAADLVSTPQPQDLPSAPNPARPNFAFIQPGSIPQNGNFSTAFLASSSGSGSNQGAAYPLSAPDHAGNSILSKLTVVGRKPLRLMRQIPSISSESAGNYAMFSPGLAKSETAEIAAKPAEAAPASELGTSAAFTSSGLRGRPSALELGANSFLWRIAQGKLLKSSDMEHWIEGYPATEGIEFSVVTASGAEVWAGGKDATLAHSNNGGLTWERITLGASATGNITVIEINHSIIRVTSSSGQAWHSHDGGRSWTMQD